MESREREVRRGLLSVLVLALLSRTPMTVDEIIDALESHGIKMPIGTIYPLLKRLETSGMISKVGTIRLGGRGKPKNVYYVTEEGRKALIKLRDVLTNILKKVLELLWDSRA